MIVRGPSGAGKSTYAKENYPEATICSADLFFEERADLNGTTYEEEFKPLAFVYGSPALFWQFHSRLENHE